VGFDQDLTRVAQDPAIRRLAERRAGSRELAEDAMQETYYAVARVKNPETIRDLGAFFRASLVNQTNHQPSAPGRSTASPDDHPQARACLLNG
jgi:DNA-directed RNA polymerase specialized sigma24 family protein